MTQTSSKRLLNILLVSACLFAAYLLIKHFFFLIFPLGCAFLLSDIIRKSFRRLHPLKKSIQKILILLILLILFALLFLLFTLALDRLIHFSEEIGKSVTDEFDRINAHFRSVVSHVEILLSKAVKKDMSGFILSRLPTFGKELITNATANIPGILADFIRQIPKWFISFFILMVSTYYFSSDWENFSSFCERTLPSSFLAALSRIKNRFSLGLKGYCKAYSLIFLLTFTELFLGFVIIGVNASFSKAILISLIDLLPVIGCGTVLIPWGIIQIIMGRSVYGISLIVLYIIITVVRQFVEPRLVGTSLGLHPVLSLVLVALGLYLFGFAGMILFPLTATCLIQEELTEKKT